MAFIFIAVLISSGNVAADQTIIPSNADSNLTVSNDAGARFDHIGNESYNFFNSTSQNAGQGQNALHITMSNTSDYGNVTFTNLQSGTIYFSDTGGRGWNDNGILMIAINGTIPDNFWVHITASGYQWDPVLNYLKPDITGLTYVKGSLNETFTKEDFLYGPQTWKPSPAYNNPIFSGQNMANTGNTFSIIFIDLWAGMIGESTSYHESLIDNGKIKIGYEFYNLPEGSLATFNAYAYCNDSKQGEGVRWTNRITDSGYHVTGISAAPVADFSADATSGTAPLTIHFTDNSTGTKPLTYAWDFNGDNVVDSTEQNPTYNYNTPGNYIYPVKLTVTNFAGSSEKIINITISVNDIADPIPSVDLSNGTYSTDQTVNLSATDDWDPNPKIYYTLNGSDPTTSSTLYNGPISLSEGTTTLKFIAVDAAGNISDLVTKIYTIDKTAPIASSNPTGGTYNAVQNITLITTDANNATTYYTTDKSDPRSSSTRTKYIGQISINTTTTLMFAAIDDAGNWSPVYTETYTMVDIDTPLPSADVPSGLYDTDKTVKLIAVDELDPNPKIYYTLDGTNPTTNSTLYSWPISINIVGTTVLKFFAVDAAGHVSDIFTNIYMLDKTGASGTWNTTQVDTNTWHNSIAVDSSGNVHIAYYQLETSGTDYPELKYAYYDGTAWHKETLESSRSGIGFYVSLTLDSLGNPHIAYRQSTPDKLKYAYKDSTGWHFYDLLVNTDVSNINLVLYNDLPQISYFANAEERLKYMYYNGTTWFSEYVTNGTTSGHWNSLVLNFNGNPRICYYDIDGDTIGLKYAKRSAGGVWQVEDVDISGNAGAWCSLALDSSNHPHISYNVNNINGGALKYAYFTGMQWIIETVDTSKTVGSRLTLDQSGNPRIIYQDVVSGFLRYAYKEGAKWIITNIDTREAASESMSIAMSPSGIPNVSYITKNSRLKYGYLMPFIVSADPKGGSYELIQTVNLTSTSGTTIYYTTDGSDPRTSSTKTKYTKPIAVNNTTTIKFAAVDLANNWSIIYTETYAITDITGPTVTANPVGGNYGTSRSVTLTTTDVNPTTTYYTTDGSDPRSSSTRTKYTGPISINTSKILMFAAVDAVGNWGPIYSETYIIGTPVNPVANFTADTWSNSDTLTVKFTDQSKNNPISWTWDFGDGTTSTVQNSSHTYSISGTYIVTLTATNPAGNDTITKSIYITVLKSNVYVNIKTSDSNPQVGDKVTYTFKLGNKGPGIAKDVVFTYVIPEGLEFAGANVDQGTWNYNETTRTLIWTLRDVAVGDPYLWLDLNILSAGTFNVNPMVTVSGHNIASEGNIDSLLVNAVSVPITMAASKTSTVPMQDTGTPITCLAMALLLVGSGLALGKRK